MYKNIAFSMLLLISYSVTQSADQNWQDKDARDYATNAERRSVNITLTRGSRGTNTRQRPTLEQRTNRNPSQRTSEQENS